MKKALIAILIALGVIILIIAGVLTYGNIYASNYTYEAPEVIEIEPNEYNTVTAVGKGLYDENGKRFDIKGINYGNLFISSGFGSVLIMAPAIAKLTSRLLGGGTVPCDLGAFDPMRFSKEV